MLDRAGARRCDIDWRFDTESVLSVSLASQLFQLGEPGQRVLAMAA
jgi:hypothetical protein